MEMRQRPDNGLRAVRVFEGVQKRGDGMKKYHVEGYFEGEIEADSVEDAEMNFIESDIDNIEITAVWEEETE